MTPLIVSRSLHLCTLLAFPLLLTLLLLGVAGAAEITVTTPDDTVLEDDACSLREAILSANADAAVGGCGAGSGADTILFALPGDGPQTISLQAGLPELTTDIAIDALSQTGASCESAPTPMVGLDGADAGAVSGLTFGETSSGSVQGLVIRRFGGHGIHIRGTDFLGVEVRCNLIGTSMDGSAVAGNGGSGIFIDNSPYNSIRQNVIAGNTENGLLIQGSEAADNVIAENAIGTNFAGADLGNGEDGILARNSGPQIIGGFYGGEGCCLGNTIAFNGGNGVTVVAQPTVSQEKGIRGNRIFANDGLGIDLADDGVTPNDPGDGDGENDANRLQNFPTLSAAHVAASSVTISGTLESSPSDFFIIEFFASDACDPSGHGEGQRVLGARQEMTDATGSVSFTAVFTGTTTGLLAGGDFVTATATDAEGNTSEFSACAQATGEAESAAIYLPDVRS